MRCCNVNAQVFPLINPNNWRKYACLFSETKVPRSGWLLQPNQPRAAAVAAQRVGDIVTRGSEPHVYREVASGGVFESDSKRVWRPQSLEERNDKTGDWQMLSPVMDTNCETFGANDTASVGGWSGGKL
ncbi:MAG: TraU family protein, partial [Candidatus Methylumidiphilus sp.]